jgi:hypothetical protein
MGTRNTYKTLAAEYCTLTPYGVRGSHQRLERFGLTTWGGSRSERLNRALQYLVRRLNRTLR